MAIYMTIMKQSNNLSASPLPVPNRTPKYTATGSHHTATKSAEERDGATQQPFHASHYVWRKVSLEGCWVWQLDGVLASSVIWLLFYVSMRQISKVKQGILLLIKLLVSGRNLSQILLVPKLSKSHLTLTLRLFLFFSKIGRERHWFWPAYAKLGKQRS